jgi:hypothetical protein
MFLEELLSELIGPERKYFEEPLCPHEKAWLEFWAYMAQQMISYPTEKAVALSMVHLFSSTKAAIALESPCDGWDMVYKSLTFKESKSATPERAKEIFDALYAKMTELDARITAEYAALEKQAKDNLERN